MAARRIEAVRDTDSVTRVARKYRVSQLSVYRWRRRAARNDLGLRKAPGRPPLISAELARSLWRPRMSALTFHRAIEEATGVTYKSLDTIYRMIAKLGLKRRADAG